MFAEWAGTVHIAFSPQADKMKIKNKTSYTEELVEE